MYTENPRPSHLNIAGDADGTIRQGCISVRGCSVKAEVDFVYLAFSTAPFSVEKGQLLYDIKMYTSPSLQFSATCARACGSVQHSQEPEVKSPLAN